MRTDIQFKTKLIIPTTSPAVARQNNIFPSFFTHEMKLTRRLRRPARRRRASAALAAAARSPPSRRQARAATSAVIPPLSRPRVHPLAPSPRSPPPRPRRRHCTFTLAPPSVTYEICIKCLYRGSTEHYIRNTPCENDRTTQLDTGRRGSNRTRVLPITGSRTVYSGSRLVKVGRTNVSVVRLFSIL